MEMEPFEIEIFGRDKSNPPDQSQAWTYLFETFE